MELNDLKFYKDENGEVMCLAPVTILSEMVDNSKFFEEQAMQSRYRLYKVLGEQIQILLTDVYNLKEKVAELETMVSKLP